jgi:PhnB protein
VVAIGPVSIGRRARRCKRLAKRIGIHDGDRAMARVSTYLNFPRCTEQAFTFYRSVFGGEFNGPIHRFAEVPAAPGQPPMAEADLNLVMHVELTILGGHVLMGTDAPESMGFAVTPGNNVHINLEPDTRAQADRLFAALAEGGKVEMPLQDMFWGAYFGNLTDRFGIRWMVNCAAKP